jgi:hypothetical protein
MRWRRLPLAVSLLAACLLLAMNVMPDVHSELETFPTPTFGKPTFVAFYTGIRDFGWPAIYRTDSFHVENATLERRVSPLGHLLGSNNLRINETERFAPALSANLMFAAAVVGLVAVALKAASNRRFSLRMLLVLTTLLGIMLGSIVYATSLPQPMPYLRFPNASS